MGGTLYLVGTPIGNLGDATERSRRTLASVDLVAAEDTRRTGRLLESLGVRSRLISFFEGNEAARVPELIEALRAGRDVAVVSDAGMPGLSDPGFRLVAACIEAGIDVDVVPGPSAAVAALVVSGLPTDRFVFEGFLPRAGRRRAERLSALVDEPRTIVLFESTRRVHGTLVDLLGALGDRPAAVCRELTKLNQEIVRSPLSGLADRLAGRELKGEAVIVVGGAPRQRSVDPADAIRVARGLVAGGARKREAAKEASARTGVPAGRIYDGLVAGQSAGAGSSSSGDRRADSSE